MKRQFLMTAAASAAMALMALGGCVTNSSPGFEAGQRPRMEEGVATTMTALYTSAPGSKELAAKARGMLVFPRVIDAGVIVGGEYGRGALIVNGRNVGSYKLTSVSLGLQAGVQSQSLVLMFMTQEALDRFTRASTWTAGADASVAIGRVGANGRLETLGESGVIAFALTNAGLMAGARVDGTRISKIPS
ncbi:MAG: BPSL1445 family SYLF domain-containing lipoprotein [Burkholderiaceae bacterium]